MKNIEEEEVCCCVVAGSEQLAGRQTIGLFMQSHL